MKRLFRVQKRKLGASTRFLTISILAVPFLIGFGVLWRSNDIRIEEKVVQASHLVDSLTLYKEQNLVLLKIIELSHSYQDLLHSTFPVMAQKVGVLNSKLSFFKSNYEILENKIAAMEGRRQKIFDFEFVPPRDTIAAAAREESIPAVPKREVIDVSGVRLERIDLEPQESREEDPREEDPVDRREIRDEAEPGEGNSVPGISSEVALENGRPPSGDPAQETREGEHQEQVREILLGRELQKRSHSGQGVEYLLLGEAVAFPSDVGELVCYTRILGARQNTMIRHRWYWNDTLQLEIPLEVKSPNWRTFSIKHIASGKVGTWRVEVLGSDNSRLAARTFVLEEAT